MNRLLILVFLAFVLLVCATGCRSVVHISGLQQTPAQSRDVKRLRFPERWHEGTDRDATFDFIQQIEVRKLSDSSDEFLFAALPNGDNDYAHEWNQAAPEPVYSGNSYAVNFTESPQVRATTKQEWESARRIVTQSRHIYWNSPDLSSGEVQYRGKKFQKSGKYWQSVGLSPGGTWLAIFSYTGERQRDLFMDGGSVHEGDIFWDVYNAVTGEKVFDWRARGVKTPTNRANPVVWLEERYLLFPEDLESQEFGVVRLPEFIRGKDPVTFTLPPRTGANGTRVPAPDNHTVFMHLPLTKEQDARIRTQQGPDLVETRFPREAGSREFFIAIREVSERGTRRQPARGHPAGDYRPAADYDYYVLSTYYYSISLDDPRQTRVLSKEEWQRAGIRSSRRLPNEKDETNEPLAARIPQRAFPKAGAIAGGALQSDMGRWTAVFSYTPAAGTGGSGRMFVEIFETRAGDRFSSTEFPYNGSAEGLFKGAVWVDGGYLLVPLTASLESFALWEMPGAR